jgi:hypothetical protein
VYCEPKPLRPTPNESVPADHALLAEPLATRVPFTYKKQLLPLLTATTCCHAFFVITPDDEITSFTPALLRANSPEPEKYKTVLPSPDAPCVPQINLVPDISVGYIHASITELPEKSKAELDGAET